MIEANRNRPCFLYLAHWGVHSPLQATRADYHAVGNIAPHRARVYAAMIRALDRSVGRIMAKLEAAGLAENTLVVISSDNGAPGYVGIEALNAPYRGGKGTFFEGGIRVPLLARWPAQVAADGRNLLPALTGKGSRPGKDAPLLSGTQDKVVRPVRMREFAQALGAGGAKVAFEPVPVGHGGALEAAEGRAALAAFMQVRAGS